MSTQELTSLLDDKNLTYKVTHNPSPQKIDMIKKSLSRKRDLMDATSRLYNAIKNA